MCFNTAAIDSADRIGGEGTRTPDPLLAKQVLYQLSYTPECDRLPRPLLGVPGFEPGTSALSELRSSQLSYTPASLEPTHRTPRPHPNGHRKHKSQTGWFGSRPAQIVTGESSYPRIGRCCAARAMEWCISDDFPVRFSELSNPTRRLRTVNAPWQFFLTRHRLSRRRSDAPQTLPSHRSPQKILSVRLASPLE